MSTTITIPETLDEATTKLGGIDELLRSTEWERSAIIASFVRLAEREGRPSQTARSGSFAMSPSEFAALGIVGLRSRMTVTRYVQAWLDTHKGRYPKPGAIVKVPADPFPPRETEQTRPFGNNRPTPETIGESIKAHPEMAQAAVESLGEMMQAGELDEQTRRDLLKAVLAPISDSPFDYPPPLPEVNEAVIEMRRRLDHVRASIDLVRITANQNPDVWHGNEDAAATMVHHGDLCYAVASLIRGVRDDELDELLSSEGGR